MALEYRDMVWCVYMNISASRSMVPAREDGKCPPLAMLKKRCIALSYSGHPPSAATASQSFAANGRVSSPSIFFWNLLQSDPPWRRASSSTSLMFQRLLEVGFLFHSCQGHNMLAELRNSNNKFILLGAGRHRMSRAFFTLGIVAVFIGIWLVKS